MSRQVWHPDDDLLIPFADGELEQGDVGRVEQHLSQCGQCRGRLAEFRQVPGAVRAILPPPPAPWTDLGSRLTRLDAEQNVRKAVRRSLLPVSRRWLAIAASVLIGIFVFRLATETTLSAAELLRNATAAESKQHASATRNRRLKVKTRKAVFVRPARSAEPAVAPELARLFSEAGYDWSEPLSARSFASWRDGLSEKDDRVRVLYNTEFGAGRFYRVTTTTSQGTLAEASITIRAGDLQAVQESFRFRNHEVVEITEDTSAAAEGPAVPPVRVAEDAGAPSATPRTTVAPTAADEVAVLAALHRIGADLGDPVEVRRGAERIDVVGLGLSAERQAQIRTALSGLRGVDVRFEAAADASGDRTAPSSRIAQAEAPPVNALHDLLAEKLGSRNTVENFTNHVLDLSEAALGRAHALRRLAERFPPEVEAALPAEAAASLADMRTTHANRLLTGVRQLSEVITPVTGRLHNKATDVPETWQAATTVLLDAARAADRSLTNALAGSGEIDRPEETLQHLAAAASELQTRATALSRAVERASSGSRP